MQKDSKSLKGKALEGFGVPIGVKKEKEWDRYYLGQSNRL